MEFLSENPDVDVSAAWERCWGIQTKIIERVKARHDVKRTDKMNNNVLVYLKWPRRRREKILVRKRTTALYKEMVLREALGGGGAQQASQY